MNRQVALGEVACFHVVFSATLKNQHIQVHRATTKTASQPAAHQQVHFCRWVRIPSWELTNVPSQRFHLKMIWYSFSPRWDNVNSLENCGRTHFEVFFWVSMLASNERCSLSRMAKDWLGGGFKYFEIFTPNPGEMLPIWLVHIFFKWVGWNHVSSWGRTPTTWQCWFRTMWIHSPTASWMRNLLTIRNTRGDWFLNSSSLGAQNHCDCYYIVSVPEGTSFSTNRCFLQNHLGGLESLWDFQPQIQRQET